MIFKNGKNPENMGENHTEMNSQKYWHMDQHNVSSVFRFLAISIILGFLLSVIIIIFPSVILKRETTLKYFYHLLFITAKDARDSWQPMFDAIQQFDSSTNESIYETIFFIKNIKFQYPLSSLLPLELIYNNTNLSIEDLIYVINILAWISILILIVINYSILKLSIEFYLNKILSMKEQGILLGLSFLMVGMFYPLTRSFNLGQVQTFLVSFVGLAILSWHLKKYIISGVFIGLFCAFKPHMTILIIWAFLRKQWKFGLSIFISIFFFTLVSVLVYGIENFVDYFRVLSYMSRYGESYFPNQSINGLMHRFLFNGNNLEWLSNSFAPYSNLVYYSTLITSIILISGALLWQYKKGPNIYDLLLVILSITMASPVAWEHHYSVLIPIYAVIIPAVLLRYKVFDRWTIPLLLIMYFLTSQNLNELTKHTAKTHFNFFQSYLFFGSLLVLFTLYKLSKVSHKETEEHEI